MQKRSLFLLFLGSLCSKTALADDTFINFADYNVKAICIANWDTNGDGELSYEEAAAASNIGTVFSNSQITTFDELQYFTGITEIPSNAFSGCNILTSITIPSSVKTIGGGAFSGSGFTTLDFPEGVEEIGSYAFYGCGELESVHFPQTLKILGESVFWECGSLISIVVDKDNPYYESPNNKAIVEIATKKLIFNLEPSIPYGTEIIGIEPFMVKEKPSTMIIPNSVKRICYRAFRGLDLTSLVLPEGIETLDDESLGFLCLDSSNLVIPKSVTSIGARLLWGSRVKSLSVAEGNPVYDSRDNCNAIVETATNTLIETTTNTVIPNSVTALGDYTFHGLKASSFIIPEGVTHIGSYAFLESELDSVVIPSSVEEIGFSAFLYCDESLPSVVRVGMNNPVVIDETTFPNRKNATLYVPSGSKAAYETTDIWKEFKRIVEFRETDQLENTLSVTTPSSMLTGNKSSMSLNLTNRDEIIMTEFYLQLPEGISIAEDEDGFPDVTINSERNNKHNVEVVLGNDGLYHFVCYSSKNYALKGNEGELFHINLVVDENMTPGTYQGEIKNILLDDINRKELTQVDYTFDITVMNVEMGDANGDGRINGLDIVELVDFIMGRPSEYFVEAASDLTGDGLVNGMDLVQMVSLVISQNYQPSHARRLLPTASKSTAAITAQLQMLPSSEAHLGLNSSGEYILTQFIVEISGGAQLLNVESDKSHIASWKPIGNDRYSVVVYSGRNSSFKSNEAIVSFNLSECCNVTIENMMVVDADRHEYWIGSVYGNNATGITKMEGSTRTTDSYDLLGRKVEPKEKGIYLVNGKKKIMP